MIWVLGSMQIHQDLMIMCSVSELAGPAINAFLKYVEIYPKCRSVKEKILPIDRLIHEFRWEFRGADKVPEATRTGSVNL